MASFTLSPCRPQPRFPFPSSASLSSRPPSWLRTNSSSSPSQPTTSTLHPTAASLTQHPNQPINPSDPIPDSPSVSESSAFEPISSRLIDIYAAFYNRSHHLAAAQRWEHLKATGYRPVRHSKLDSLWWAEERRRGRVQPDHELSYPLLGLQNKHQSSCPHLKPPSSHAQAPQVRRLHSLARPVTQKKPPSKQSKPADQPASPSPPRMLHKHSPEIMDLVGDAAAFGQPDLDYSGPDFESDSSSELARVLGSEPGAKGIKGLKPGSFLELRRTNQSESGILVRSQGNEVLYVSRSGEIRLSIIDNVMYTMHGLVSEEIAIQAIDDDYAIEALNDPIVPTRASVELVSNEALQAKAESLLRARKQCCRALRMLEKRVDKCHATLTKAGSYNLYERFKHRDPSKAGAITSPQAVRFLLGGQAGEDETMVFALHQQLMDNADMFVANTRDMRDESRFMVQSQNTLTALYTVRDWIALDSAELRSFVKKSKAIILTYRAQAHNTGPATPIHLAPHAFEPWTPTDLMFIRVFRTIATNQRMIQDQPYSTIVASILKQIGLYDAEAMAKSWPSLTLDRFGAIALLKDLGILPRWQSVGLWNPDLDLEKRVGDQVGIAARSLGKADRAKIAAPPPAKLSSGPNTVDDGLLENDPADALRYDFEDLAVYIIDDPSAEELDDGISIESLASSPLTDAGTFPKAWIHVHIADPTASLPPSHPISMQARSHLDTLYLPGFTLPMLPGSLIKSQRMSLGSNDKHGRKEAQKTLTFSARVDEQGNVVEWKVRPGCIRNTKTLTYKVVSEVIDGTPGPTRRQIRLGRDVDEPDVGRSLSAAELDAADVTRIRALMAVARALTQRRVADGALGWHLPLADVSVRPDPLLWPVLGTPPFPRLVQGTAGVCMTLPPPILDAKSHRWGLGSAQALVMEMMLLAGRVTGKLYGAHSSDDPDLLLPFRSQPSPETLSSSQNARMLAELRKHICPTTGLVSPINFQKSRVVFMPATNGLSPALHFPLGIGGDEEGYCKVTSPLRRYSDLVCHWQIKNFLLRRSGLKVYEEDSDLGRGILDRIGMEGLVGRLDREGKPLVNLARKTSLSWVSYCIKEVLSGRGVVDEETKWGLENGLTAVILQEPVLMRYTNRWSMKSYVPELGLRASLLVDQVEPWFSSWVLTEGGSYSSSSNNSSNRLKRKAEDDPVGKRVPVKIAYVNEEDHVVVKVDYQRLERCGVVDLAGEFEWSE